MGGFNAKLEEAAGWWKKLWEATITETKHWLCWVFHLALAIVIPPNDIYKEPETHQVAEQQNRPVISQLMEDSDHLPKI